MVRRSAALALALLLAACGPAAAPASQSSPTPTQTPVASAPGASATASATAPAATTRPPQSAQCGQILLADFTLANDLSCDKDALIAGADNITIDLGGKTLKGPGMGPQTWPAPQLDSVGVRVEGRVGVTVKNGNTSDFSTGVYFDQVKGSVIEGIRTERNRYGLYIHHTTGSTVRKNHVAVNIYGLHLQNADDNLIQGNQLVRQTYNSPGGYGIYLFASQRNKIIENDIENNVNWGIWFSEARNNLTYHNNVAGNRPQVSDNTEGNTWHDAATKRGNYWGDYRGRDTNADGIGDSGAYLILGPADVVDPYPFVERDGWKKASRTIDTYSPPVGRAPKEVQVLALTSDGSVVSARPGVSAVTDTGVRGTSIALQSDGHTLYALDGQRLQVWDAVSGSSRVQQVSIRDGVVAANRDGVSALVVSRTGAQQVDTTSGLSEFFAYSRQPGGIAPSYKHNHIFVGTERGLDLFYLNLGGRTPYTIPLSGPAGPIAMNGSGTRVYVAIRDTNTIDVVDTEQYAVVSRISVGGPVDAMAVSPREDRLYVAVGGHELVAIDLGDRAVRQRVTYFGAIVDIAVSPNGDELYLGLLGLDQGIAVVNARTLATANIVPLERAPTRILVASY
jgi:parallel beta-helix repeat protein